MKKLLIISPHLPWPLSTGGGVGVYYLLSYVSQYVKVTFLTSYNRRNNYHSLNEIRKRLPNVDFNLYDYRKYGGKGYEVVRKIEKRIDSHLKFGEETTRHKLNITDLMTPNYIQYINEVIDEKKIDIVQVEFESYLPLVYALPNKVKKIFIHHELRFVRNNLQFKDDIYSRFMKDFMKDNEISACNRFDTVVTLTQVDKEKLLSNGVKTNVIVSTLAISDTTKPYKKQCFMDRLTFIGGSSHFPNLDGLKWFLSYVYPNLQNALPNLNIDIIGKWSKSAMKEIYDIDPNVNFLGFVDDLSVVLDNSLMVVPIQIGSGMRMKILEAANNSTPFVSTEIGAEGLSFKSGYDCFISKCAEDMVRDIVLLCTDKSLYKDYSINCHKTFVENYSIEYLGNVRLGLYNINTNKL